MKDVISQFEKLLKEKGVTKFQKLLSPMSIEELNKRIDKSENDFRNGRYKTSHELIAKYK